MMPAKKTLLKLAMAALLLSTAVSANAAEASAPARSAQVELTSREPQVRIVGSRLEVTTYSDEPVTVSVYALTGQLVKQFQTSGTSSVELPSGYYIVKCGNITKRVAIK